MTRQDKWQLFTVFGIFMVCVFGMGMLVGGEVFATDTEPYETDIRALIDLTVELSTPETYDQTVDVLQNLKSPTSTTIFITEKEKPE